MSRRCLVVHPGALGDVLLAGPALVHLRALGYRSTAAVASRLVPLLEGSGLVDAAVDLESLALHRLFVEPPDPDALRALAGFDAVVSWMGAGDAAFRRSLAGLGRPAVVARATPPPGTGLHVSRHLVDTLAPLGPVAADLPDWRVRAREAERNAAASWLEARGIGPDRAVVLQPGAGSAAKTWPGFGELARRIRAAGHPVVALAGPADRLVVAALLADGALDEARVARDWPLPRIAALFGLARAAVGNDSGPTHLAAATGCPTVAVFGPTDPAAWAPVGPRVHVAAPEAGESWPTISRVETSLRAILDAARAGGARLSDPARADLAWR